MVFDNVKNYNIDGCSFKSNLLIINKNIPCNFSYISGNILDKHNGMWYFNLLDKNKYNSITLKIPKKNIVENVSPVQLIYFEDNYIIFNWNNISPSEINLMYDKKETKFSPIIYILILIFLIGIIALIIYFYLMKKKRNKNLISKIKSNINIDNITQTVFNDKQLAICNTLSESEQKIVLTIANNTLLTQKSICFKCDLPKSTVSRWISKLCDKNILSCNDSIHTKKVSLSDWFKNLN